MKRNNIILLFALLLLANFSRAQSPVLVVDSLAYQPIVTKNAIYVSYYIKNIGHKLLYQTFVYTDALFLNHTSDTCNNYLVLGTGGASEINYVLDSGAVYPFQISASIPIDSSLHLDNSSIVIIWPTGAGFSGHGSFISSAATSSDTSTIYISYSGIDPNSATANYLKFYPQPATNTINIFYNNPSISIKGIVLIDISGEKVNNYSFDEKSINISQISAGVYFLQVTFSNGETGTYKIMKGGN